MPSNSCVCPWLQGTHHDLLYGYKGVDHAMISTPSFHPPVAAARHRSHRSSGASATCVTAAVGSSTAAPPAAASCCAHTARREAVAEAKGTTKTFGAPRESLGDFPTKNQVIYIHINISIYIYIVVINDARCWLK